MEKITTWLWFDTEAEEAAEFYTSIFPDSRITDVSHYGEAGPRPAGSVMTVGFEVMGRQFFGLNGGANHKIGGVGISFMVTCESQDELDRVLGEARRRRREDRVRLVTDRYGVAWQIIPKRLHELLSDPDRRDGATRDAGDAADDEDRGRRARGGGSNDLGLSDGW